MPPSSVCEEKVFKTVFYENAQSLKEYMYYKCGNQEKAEDFMQDAFSKLWENCAKVPFEKARSFIFKIANNLFLNEVKRDKVVLKFKKRLDDNVEVENPEFIYQKKEFHELLERTISSLPEDQRTIFLLNRIEKKKYREIAEMLDISVKTVEKKMHLALKELRKVHPKV